MENLIGRLELGINFCVFSQDWSQKQSRWNRHDLGPTPPNARRQEKAMNLEVDEKGGPWVDWWTIVKQYMGGLQAEKGGLQYGSNIVLPEKGGLQAEKGGLQCSNDHK